MNLSDLKISANNMIVFTDSLATSLLSFKLTINDSTIAPSTNDLIIYVDTSEEVTEARKNYVFNLNEVLSNNDTFIMEPVIHNKNIELKAYVKKTSDEVEELEYQNIMLFEGTNYIYTNYENATIDIIYPKNTDLVKYYLNNILYSLNSENKVLSLDDIYFKDAFTESNGSINANFNNLSINCLSSNNNKFNLDSDGNLTVNSLTTTTSSSNTNFDEIYPVGSIYLSVNATNPSNLFGGTWEQIKDKFLLACGDTYANGTTGGEATHTLTVNEMPSHNHTANASSSGAHTHTASTSSAGAHTHTIRYHNFNGLAVGQGYLLLRRNDPDDGYLGTDSDAAMSAGAHTHTVTVNSAGAHTHTVTVNNTGASQSHNNMPPYLSIYIWKRTA